MIQHFSYGEGFMEVDIPGSFLGALRPGVNRTGAGEATLIADALENPVGTSRLRDIVAPGETVAVVISDLTRLWVRQHLFIPRIVDELLAGGVDPADITLVAATGDHRGHTRDEWDMLVGEDLPASIGRLDHDARDDQSMVPLGETTRGTPVAVNCRVVESDRIVITGGIVYHFLSGFSGGMKALLPGVSGYATIMANHSLALAEAGGVRRSVAAGRMAGNPCSEDIWEGGGMAHPDFLFNVVVDDETHRIVEAVAGDPHEAHRRGREVARANWEVPIAERAEVVWASSGGYPKDINLYQTYKTLYGARRAVRPGGTVVIASQCPEGMGNDDFAATILEYADNAARERALRERFTIGGYMAYHAALMAAECDVLLISDMPAAEIRSAGMVPVPDLSSAADRVRAKYGGGSGYYVMPSGSAFPVVKGDD